MCFHGIQKGQTTTVAIKLAAPHCLWSGTCKVFLPLCLSPPLSPRSLHPLELCSMRPFCLHFSRLVFVVFVFPSAHTKTRITEKEKLKEAEKAAQELREGFGAEESKSVEMAAELLTLVNQKTHLQVVRSNGFGDKQA